MNLRSILEILKNRLKLEKIMKKIISVLTLLMLTISLLNGDDTLMIKVFKGELTEQEAKAIMQKEVLSEIIAKRKECENYLKKGDEFLNDGNTIANSYYKRYELCLKELKKLK